ncbi:TetR/AcrR family transcriptional regulator [Cryobacterium sp. TMT1-3]|uniref:TetR/AcrR family transcriptional regulator n=1 Tax=Cryobacterium luteum TaxID=1424661 RepID=A0A1H8F1H4_9MICO|nr:MULTISPECIES: TetR/AcrR family transcriptional regulator [Cryobacterium]TFB85480.1 TetR/AcrR family transcriptional regulator [Cryobacterium luteum]TFC26616.1 TetR/AcrR family transcriptional regulator [Cryobacterium sp. TMT1-3]SEN25579.1 transcriptional regulator, TetR family [Cryobacterium luteum]
MNQDEALADTPPPGATVRAQTRHDKHHATSLRVERSAVSLVLEHGFDSVTVDMICSQSGISQRTFFNYFKTKKAAIIGAEPPTIDEGRAREFIAAPGDDLLPDVLTLMSAIGPREGMDEQLFTDRLRIFGLHPELMQEQMERMTRVTSEITELVYLRLGRGATVDGENDPELAFRHGQAELLTHAMLGVVRFMALQWIPDFERPAGAAGRTDRAAAPTLAESLSRTVELLRRTLSIPGL